MLYRKKRPFVNVKPCVIVSLVGELNKSTSVRVAFDTSVLGYAQYGAGGRTGVFRMVDCLARELARSPYCEVGFCAAENYKMWVHARRYLKNVSDFSNSRLLSYGRRAQFYDFLGRPLWRLGQGNLSLSKRAFRRGLGHALHLLEQESSPLRPKDLQGFNIFHSPFYKLPDSTLKVPGLKRILTVCDLINILHPEVSLDQGKYLRSILKTVTPEDWVIAISETTKDDFCAFRKDMDPKRVFVVPLAASGSFYPASESQIGSVRKMFQLNNPYFLSVCTLDKRKNLDAVIQAFAQLTQENQFQADLVLVGYEGDAHLVLQRRMAELKISHRVKTLGYVADSHLAPLYSGALAFVYPSLFEGFGLPVLEAMQCGTPVCTSDRGALKEVAGNAALLVDPRATVSWAEALWSLVNQDELRKQLSQRGVERARGFSWQKSFAQLLNAYQTAVFG